MKIADNAIQINGIPWLPGGLAIIDYTKPGSATATLNTKTFESGAPWLFGPSSNKRWSNDVLVVLAKRPSPGVLLHWHLMLKQDGIRVYAATAQGLRHSIETDSAEQFIRQLLSSWSANPFSNGMPVTSALEYFGDGHRVQRLLRLSDSTSFVLVVGLPKVGISSLLNRFCEEIPAKSCVRIDGKHLAQALDQDTLWQRFARCIGVASTSSADEMAERLSDEPQVLVIDDIDALYNDQPHQIDMLEFLRRLATTPHSTKIIAGSHSLEPYRSRTLRTGHMNPLWRIASVLRCDTFSAAETADYFESNGRRSGIMFDGHAALMVAFELTGGHPFLCRHLGQEATRRVHAGQAVTANGFRAAGNALLHDLEDFLSTLFTAFGPVASQLLLKIDGMPLAGASLSREERTALDLLQRMSLVVESEGRPRILSKMLLDFVGTCLERPASPHTSTLYLTSPRAPDRTTGLLTMYQVEVVVEAAILAGVAHRRRSLLMANIPVEVVSALATDARPADQLRSDVLALNSMPCEGGFYITAWLQNAARLAGARKESIVLQYYAGST